MHRLPRPLAVITLFALTYGSLSTLGWDKTADLFIIIIGVLLLYSFIAERP